MEKIGGLPKVPGYNEVMKQKGSLVMKFLNAN